jgi:hypothetical protein
MVDLLVQTLADLLGPKWEQLMGGKSAQKLVQLKE